MIGSRGIRSQTTQIRTDVKEYSEGTIRSLEIVETQNDGALFRMTAKVGVRVEDFLLGARREKMRLRLGAKKGGHCCR